MPLATELELPTFDHTDPALQRRRATAPRWPHVHGYDGWLASNPFGFTVLDRESRRVLPAHEGRRCFPD